MLFVYGERQINSVVLPAIYEISDAVFVEQPITRLKNRKTKEEGSGLIDFWVMYGRNVFLIEMKHAWMSSKTIDKRQDLENKWINVNEQINEITDAQAKELAYGKLKPLKISILVAPLYESSKDEKKLVPKVKEDLTEIIDEFNSLVPKPNFLSVWNLPAKMQGPYEYDDYSELYSNVVLAARVVQTKHCI